MSGDIEIIKSRLEKEDVEMNPKDRIRGFTPLSCAARENSVEAIE